MSRDAFWHVHGLIQHDPIFQSSGQKPQRPVKYQLAAYLVRFGSNTSIRTAAILSLAEGTVYLYTRHVFSALHNIQTEHLFWPGPMHKDFLKKEMAEFGFPGCIGIIDGTLIWLVEKPLKDGWAYFSCKKFYAVSDPYLSHELTTITVWGCSSLYRLLLTIMVFFWSMSWAGMEVWQILLHSSNQSSG